MIGREQLATDEHHNGMRTPSPAKPEDEAIRLYFGYNIAPAEEIKHVGGIASR